MYGCIGYGNGHLWLLWACITVGLRWPSWAYIGLCGPLVVLQVVTSSNSSDDSDYKQTCKCSSFQFIDA